MTTPDVARLLEDLSNEIAAERDSTLDECDGIDALLAAIADRVTDDPTVAAAADWFFDVLEPLDVDARVAMLNGAEAALRHRRLAGGDVREALQRISEQVAKLRAEADPPIEERLIEMDLIVARVAAELPVDPTPGRVPMPSEFSWKPSHVAALVQDFRIDLTAAKTVFDRFEWPSRTRGSRGGLSAMSGGPDDDSSSSFWDAMAQTLDVPSC